MASLFLAAVCILGPARAEPPPLAWAGLEGAVLTCADASCDNANGFLNRVFFVDASDTWGTFYEFEDARETEISVRESRTVRLAHLERITVAETRLGLMANPPSWLAEATVRYLILRRETGGHRVALQVWRPTGALKPGAAVFTVSDLDVFSRWPKMIQSAIREQRIVIGMTPAQVVMSRGRPRKRERLTEGTTVSEHWSYQRSAEIVFMNGKVTRIREELRP